MIFLDHGSQFFDAADHIIARILTLVGSIGALLVAVRAVVQNLHASQAASEAEVVAAKAGMVPDITGREMVMDIDGAGKKVIAMCRMATAHPLLRASPARASALIERKVAKLKAAK